MIKFDFKGKIKSFDILSSKEYTIFTKQGEVITEQLRCKIDEGFSSPIIKRLDDDHFLIADSSCGEKEKNVKIYNAKGKLEYEFAGGDSIRDIKIYDRKFVFSYYDHGIMEKKNISQEGLVIFNKRGKILYGFNSKSEFEIWDCYHTIKTDSDKVLFFGYGKLPVLELNLNYYTLTEAKIPVDFYADSISYFNEKLYWKKSNQLWIWDKNLKTKTIQKLSQKKDKRFLVKDNLVSLSEKGYEFEKIKTRHNKA